MKEKKERKIDSQSGLALPLTIQETQKGGSLEVPSPAVRHISKGSPLSVSLAGRRHSSGVHAGGSLQSDAADEGQASMWA